MSVRVEWMDSPHIDIEIVEAGTELPDGQVTDTEAIVLSADSVVVIEGDIKLLVARLSDQFSKFQRGESS